MTTAPFNTLVHYLRGLATCAGADDTPDQELLRRFVERRDESAFAAIVRRHGSMVLRVCRRVLHDAGAAEDAFQVTFVILSQKAAALREGGLLANWLYGVARRTALKARTLATRRRRREQQTAVPPILDPLAELSLRESLTVLDEELSRLPAKFQAPLLLCCLEGHTRDEAAQQLGWPLALVKSRLEQARDLLRKRLTRRGLTLSAGLFTVLLSECAVHGAVPAALMATTVQAAAGGVVPPQLAALTQGVLKTMFLTKFKAAMALFMAVTMIGLGGSLLAHRRLADGTASVVASNESHGPSRDKGADQAKAPLPERPKADHQLIQGQPRAAAPIRKGPNQLLFYRSGRLALTDPDGRNEKKMSGEGEKSHPLAARLSPDGKRLAVFQVVEKVTAPVGTDIVQQAKVASKLFIRGTEEKGLGTDMGASCRTCAWSPDGSEIAYTEVVFAGKQPQKKGRHWVENVTTREKAALKLPDTHTLLDWSRDGNIFLTTDADLGSGVAPGKLYLINRDGTQRKILTGEEPGWPVGAGLSPDGKRVLYVRLIPLKDGKAKWKKELVVLDIETVKASRVAGIPPNGAILGFCWSPDGKQIAYTWKEQHEGKPEDLIGKETQLVVCDPDGKNRRTVVTERAPVEITTLGQVDWR